MTEETLGAEIRATMDTVVVAHTASGTPVHLNTNAAAADRMLPVNRIKPHTCFKGPIESGCMKMAVVGSGKASGRVPLVHSCGPVGCAIACSTRAPRCARRGGCSAASARSSRPPATSCASRA